MVLTYATRHLVRAGVRRLVVLTLVVACQSAIANGGALASSSSSSARQASAVAPPSRMPDLEPGPASPKVTNLAQWVVASHDNAGMPYVIIDKVNAEVFVFDPVGRLQAAAPALLGLARGDRSVKGIGDRKMSAIRPQERITPAGRFIASLAHDPQGKEILWVDYKDAIALHPVVKGTPQERRAERLKSPSSADKRISYGCINVPLKFYANFVSPAFAHTSGIVYILPEEDSARDWFGSYGLSTDTKLSISGQP